MPYILGIRFQPIGKIYHFDASQFTDIQPGDFAIVETARGTQLGQVIRVVEDPMRPLEGTWKPIQRRATAQDLVLRQTWQRQEAEAVVVCREKAKELNLIGVKFVSAEYSFDGSRLSFLYSVEEGEKIDLTSLRRALQRVYLHTQVEMHQVGPRDVAKLLGGMGACGLACRCCSAFLTDFSPVSIKMAKEQGISLTPTEITGMCGRLRCCLIYEYELYAEARKLLPKRNKRVVTPSGEGRVLDSLPLQDAVIVELENGVRQTFQRTEIEPWDELSALRQKAEAPCPKKQVVGELGVDGDGEVKDAMPSDFLQPDLSQIQGGASPREPSTEQKLPPSPQPRKRFSRPAKPPSNRTSSQEQKPSQKSHLNPKPPKPPMNQPRPFQGRGKPSSGGKPPRGAPPKSS